MKEKKSAKKPSQTAASPSPVASSVRASGVGSPSGTGKRSGGGVRGSWKRRGESEMVGSLAGLPVSMDCGIGEVEYPAEVQA